MKIPSLPLDSRLSLFSGVLALSAFPAAHAAVITEYFNDYGAAQVGLVSGALNGGSGWSGAWQGGSASSYQVGNVANYSGSGYSSEGNDATGGNDGRAGGTGTGTVSYRTFSSALTGTIWISATIFQSTDGDVLFWLDKTDTSVTSVGRDFVGLRGTTGTTGGSTPEPVISYDAADDTASEANFPNSTTHLMLIRIDMNYSGTLDAISMWMNPTLTGGIAGLGSALYSKNTLDAYGTGFDGIGLSMSATSNGVDSIRISNDPDAFDFVITGVPEPTSAALSLLGTALLLRRRRK